MQLNKYKAIFHLLFLNNGYWKLLALIIAVLVYFTIRSDISHMRVISVPVELTSDSADDDAAVWSIEPRSVKVSIRGSYVETSEIADSTIKCVIRAKQKSSSIMDAVRIKVRAKHIQGIRDARVVKIDPAYIDVKFDVPASFQLAVAPPVTEGSARGTVKLSYDVTNAVVTGSRRLLGSLDLENTQIQCEPIDVTDRLESFTTRVRLVPPGDASNLTLDPAEMFVNVYVTSEKATRKVEGVPVIITQPAGSPNQWTVEPNRVDIEISGRSELLKDVQFGDVMASVNGNVPIVPGLTNQVPVIAHVRQGLEVDSAKSVPENVNLIPVAFPKELKPAPASSPATDQAAVK